MPANENNSVLRVESDGGVRVAEVASLLDAVEKAYNGVLVFQKILDDAGRWGREFPIYALSAQRFWPFDFRKGRRPNPFQPSSITSFVSGRQRLVLLRVRLESPGNWDFFGVSHALEVLRKYINDRYDRKKDEYRIPLEKERLSLENEILRNQALEGRIRIVKNLGATEEDLAPLLDLLVFRPLDKLSGFQNKGLITGAKLLDTDETSEKE